MNEVQDWLWLLKTDKGEFFGNVVGKWTQEEAATWVRAVFHGILKLTIVSMIPRKRCTGQQDNLCTIFEQQEKVGGIGAHFLAGRKVWEACGRGAEFEAELIRQRSE